MKLQLRFLVVLLVVFVAVAGTLGIQRAFDLQRSQQVLKSELKQRKSLFGHYLASEGSELQTFSEDYSFWDDMVNFVKTDDVDFAHVNLDSGLSTFGADADWVYKPDGSQLYYSKADPSIPVSTLPLPQAFFTKLTADKFEHFYLQLPGGTFEIRAATIVPGNDPDHHDPPSGFWVVGRFLNGDFIQSMNDLSQSSISLKPATASAADMIGNSSVSFVTPLKSWQGETVGYINSASRVSVISNLNTIYRRELALLVVISIILIFFVSLAIWRLILMPIQLIVVSIERQQPDLISGLSTDNSQVGNLAKTVQQFFKQRLVIQEDQFKKAELEKLNRDKTAFLTLAAHELKAPITVAKMLSGELNETFRGTANTSQLFSKLDIINAQIMKMVVLIKDIRLASEGKDVLSFNNSFFDFDTFLQKELTSARIITRQQLIFEGGTGRQVYADSDRLSQVVSNLIRNAAKYSPKADKIIIRSSVINSDVVVDVEDFGVGIALEDQPHIFEKYFRASNVASSFEGFGLGLSICRDIIFHQGGNIWVESSPGHGTHLYFSIPFANLPPSSKQAPASSNTP